LYSSQIDIEVKNETFFLPFFFLFQIEDSK
jgi:hypothetical protein